ncbi:hypothetical protein NLJ89_g7136 [Agrocybe chaxingu]|uniref:Uncharacterized protein n=1 Tax=Agrocybe chaxingu TaxID=84603 RepID=A0A9W8JXY2_9AGAR|nr:hypothetical protein NLJ89_g7136 [Agrocybe chaxingu]
MSATDRVGNTFHIQHRDAAAFDEPNIIDLRLPWSQLVSLELADIPLAPDVVLILMHRTARAVVEGSFHVAFDVGRASGPNSIPPAGAMSMDVPEVRMTRLKKLTIIVGGETLDAHFLDRIHIPQLRDLQIGLNLHQELNPGPFTRFVASCSTKLERLALVDAPYQINNVEGTSMLRYPQLRPTYLELESLLESTPNIRTLHLPRSILIHATTLEKLANGTLLPSLRVLGATTSSTRNAEEFLSMLTARMTVAAAANARCDGANLDPGPSNFSSSGGARGVDEEEASPLAPITSLVLGMPFAEGGTFVDDVVPKYLPFLGCVEIRIESF